MRINKSNYGFIAKSVVIVLEFLAMNFLFHRFITHGGLYIGDQASILQLHITSSLCYFVAVSQGGISFYKRTVKAYQIANNISRASVLYAIYVTAVFALNRRVDVSDGYYYLYLLSIVASSAIIRYSLHNIIKNLRRKGKNLQHCVIVGSSSNCIELYNEITNDLSMGCDIVGYFDHKPSDRYPEKCQYLGKPETVIEWLKEHRHVQYLFCSLPSAQSEIIVPIIKYCENNLVHFYSLPNLHNYLHNRVYFGMIGTVPYLSLFKNPLSSTDNRIIKRTFDILFSGLFLCTLFPIVLIIVTIITKITMPGPVFFKQKRNGLNDKEFYCYKFRSMKVNAQADTLQATKDDPRKTKWGNIMRKTSIDELPQFINVLKGDMSVVGPRPHMVKHTEEYSKLIDKYMVRHYVKPGITGWSQVTGFRGETKELKDMEGRIKGDIYYIEHWSFWLDIYIIYKTVANVFHGEKNAY